MRPGSRQSMIVPPKLRTPAERPGVDVRARDDERLLPLPVVVGDVLDTEERGLGTALLAPLGDEPGPVAVADGLAKKVFADRNRSRPLRSR